MAATELGLWILQDVADPQRNFVVDLQKVKGNDKSEKLNIRVAHEFVYAPQFTVYSFLMNLFTEYAEDPTWRMVTETFRGKQKVYKEDEKEKGKFEWQDDDKNLAWEWVLEENGADLKAQLKSAETVMNFKVSAATVKEDGLSTYIDFPASTLVIKKDDLDNRKKKLKELQEKDSKTVVEEETLKSAEGSDLRLVIIVEEAKKRGGRVHYGYWVFSIVLGLLGLVLAFTTMPPCGSEADDDEKTKDRKSSFTGFQLSFLAAWYICGMVEWLNGPLTFDVISEAAKNAKHGAIFAGRADFGTDGMEMHVQQELMVFGFLAGALVGPCVGSIGDVVGRKRLCQFFCIGYMAYATLLHFESYWYYAVAQMINGVTCRIFFTAFEAWYVSEHVGRNYDGDKLGVTLGWMWFGNSLVAISSAFVGILAGLIWNVDANSHVNLSSMLPEWLSLPNFWFAPYLRPAEAMIAFAVLGFVVITLTWSEGGHGAAAEDEDEESTPGSANKKKEGVFANIRECFRVCDRKIFSVLISMAIFEGAMMLFVLNWFPAVMGALLRANASTTLNGMETKWIFCLLLTGWLIGSCLFNLIRVHFVPKNIIWVLMLVSCVAMFSVATTVCWYQKFVPLRNTYPYDLDNETIGLNWLTSHLPWAIVLGGCVVFEVCIGCYFPSMGTLKAELVPDHIRATMTNLFYVPMNIFLCIIPTVHVWWPLLYGALTGVGIPENSLPKQVSVSEWMQYYIVSIALFSGTMMMIYYKSFEEEEETDSEESDDALEEFLPPNKKSIIGGA